MRENGCSTNTQKHFGISFNIILPIPNTQKFRRTVRSLDLSLSVASVIGILVVTLPVVSVIGIESSERWKYYNRPAKKKMGSTL